MRLRREPSDGSSPTRSFSRRPAGAVLQAPRQSARMTEFAQRHPRGLNPLWGSTHRMTHASVSLKAADTISPVVGGCEKSGDETHACKRLELAQKIKITHNPISFGTEASVQPGLPFVPERIRGLRMSLGKLCHPQPSPRSLEPGSSRATRLPRRSLAKAGE